MESRNGYRAEFVAIGGQLVTTTHKHKSLRRVDAASLTLMLIGVASAIFAYWLITVEHFNPLLIVPAIVATTLGATHLIKRGDCGKECGQGKSCGRMQEQDVD